MYRSLHNNSQIVVDKFWIGKGSFMIDIMFVYSDDTDGLVYDCSMSIANVLEILQTYTKSLIYMQLSKDSL